ncbi:hypothetical protein Tco_0503839 [Tanacetum coccineum]
MPAPILSTSSDQLPFVGQMPPLLGGIFSIEARDMDTKLLSAPESNNTLARCSSLGIVVGVTVVVVIIVAVVVVVESSSVEKPKPFKFFNVVLLDDRFKDMVRNGWLAQVYGFYMFRVVKKLKGLKKPIRKLMYDKGNLHANVVRLREELDKMQTDLDNDPINLSFRENEAATVVAFNEALLMEEKFLKQKAKSTWLREGDSNTTYFHKVVKSCVSQSRIDVVTDANGAVYHNNDVAKTFINHYEVFLGQPGDTSDFNTDNLFPTRLNDSEALNMVCDISSQEVKSAMFSMGNDKSPGPDDFTAGFFKDTWDIIGADVTKAVSEFFTNGRLLKELNHTIIALIPKVNTLARVNDYRPISCCNVLFKCISKIIANRLKDSLQRLIMHNYHLDHGVPRCAFKVDIQKAYDTVDWNFLRVILIGFGFHERMIAWIMECVTTTSFSISINGSLHGYFKGKRGLRQGDPLSPYLFTLIMEVFTLILHRRVQEASNFTYHRFCSELDLINLCFADDLFLFVHGDVNSAKVIKEALDDFKDASGLNPSMPKSKAYFCNVINYTKLAILNVLPFEEERLPVKYLGVPLVSSRLIFRDCKELINKVHNRVNDWKTKSLSMREAQIIQSVFGFSLHCVLGSVFKLFLHGVMIDMSKSWWFTFGCQGSMCRGKAKVAWDVVCLPKQEGGLGVRRLDHFNKALMVSHVWKLLSLKESLWREETLLALRPLIGSLFSRVFGDGKTTSIWFDKWCVASPLSNIISARDIARAGFTHASKDNLVSWYDFVWFHACIPRHAFNMWLIFKQRLRTQDCLRSWEVVAGLAVVWSRVQQVAGLTGVGLSCSIVHDSYAYC